MSVPKLDKDLWFMMGEHCPGPHYILGNPHTFPGRMLASCPAKQVSFCFSLCEIEEESPMAKAWMRGFLAGNEPAPPLGKNAEVDCDSNEYREWLALTEQFRKSGEWDLGEGTTLLDH